MTSVGTVALATRSGAVVCESSFGASETLHAFAEMKENKKGKTLYLLKLFLDMNPHYFVGSLISQFCLKMTLSMDLIASLWATVSSVSDF